MYTYKLGGLLITDELYHDDLDAMTFGRKDQNELRHHGIKGQSWGKRRFQNEDGSLTAAGRNRYDVGNPKQGVTAYSDTGGRGGSGVRTYKGVSNKSAISTNSQNRYGGASGGGGSIRPNGSPTTRTYGGGTNGSSSYSFEYNEGPGQSAGRSVSNKVKAKVNNTVNSGKKAADNLFGRIGNLATKAANDVGKAATNAWDDVSATARGVADSVGNRLTGNIDRNTAESLRRTADFQEDPNAPFHAMGEQYTPENLRKQAEEYQRKADNSLFGRIGNAAKDVGNAFNDAKNWVGDRARDVGNLVSNQDEKRAAENAQNVADRVLEDAIARSGEYVPDEKGGEDLYIRDYNDAKVVDAADKRAADAQQAYENHPLTKIQNAAKDVGNFATNAYNDVSKVASDAANNVGRSIGEGVRKAGDWASNAASDVRDWGAGALDKGRQAFENLFGRSESTANEKLDPTPKTFTENIIEEQWIPEQRIPEQRIPEQRIPEQLITEDRIKEQRIPEQRTYEFGDSGMAGIAREFANRQNSQNNLSSNSSMTDKPDGVSDEYWENYTSNGGTRDSYERQMNARKNFQSNQNGSTTRQQPVVTVDNSRPHHFELDKSSGQTVVVYDDEKRR